METEQKQGIQTSNFIIDGLVKNFTEKAPFAYRI
jgi:hypothetical protein